ncbi:Rieske 2Fe-2S domain-containing protein [Bacillus shivajii]|uniref:Rieske (2Fe-2S) protein n=1 Tax=Bacillus shivajii TaxID=1983719 RepID=UPI001CFB55C5|nr:Rieske 2Fe-2S domain-containing protein [Bacillus shivajii]UCZ51399.1 Rieske 2Fe-2S domain-containing protein [Bacillus shivajii]
MSQLIFAGTFEEVKSAKTKVIKGGKHGIAVIYDEGRVYAIDNRCPHLGFPLHMGSTCDGMLTCHWHHARFDIKSGGTLDPWADDVPTYPVKINDEKVYIDPNPHTRQTITRLQERLREGLEQNLSLVIAKAVVGLIEGGESEQRIVQIGVEFGTKHRQRGWRSGLTILTAMTNILPYLDHKGKILALYQGLVHVARESQRMGTRFLLGPLPLVNEEQPSMEKLAKWYRHNMEVRDVQGAERVLLTAIELGATKEELADMMMTAITDHFYMNIGHTLDFHNKAFEVLKHVDDECRDQVLTSLLPELSSASRSEESHSWQAPINLVDPLLNTFDELTQLINEQEDHHCSGFDESKIVDQVLSDRPLETIDSLTNALKQNVSPIKLAQLVTLAAAERVAKFHVQNEFRDWITVLHTFTHAHAVHEALKRSITPELTRAVYHAAMSVYLDRFLNTPSARRPQPNNELNKNISSDELLTLLNQQQQTDQAAKWVVNYLASGGDKKELFNTLGHALLREDAEFHSFQMYEAAIVEHENWSKEGGELAERAKQSMIIAVTRYLAAHAPTSREIPHTATIAMRLFKGEKLFEE